MSSSKYTIKASTARDYRAKSIFICAIMTVFAIVAFVLAIYNFFHLKFGFFIGYIIGFSVLLVMISFKMNVTFSTKITADRSFVYLTAWENRLLPYKASLKTPFIREFISDKIVTDKIRISDIKDVYIGTKSYISRISPDSSFSDSLKGLLPQEDLNKISKSDLLCIYDKNSEYHLMNVESFDVRSLCKIVSNILRVNEKAEFHSGSKKYRLYLRK